MYNSCLEQHHWWIFSPKFLPFQYGKNLKKTETLCLKKNHFILHILTIFGQYFSIIISGNLPSILKFYESNALKLLWLCMEKFEISVWKSTSDISQDLVVLSPGSQTTTQLTIVARISTLWWVRVLCWRGETRRRSLEKQHFFDKHLLQFVDQSFAANMIQSNDVDLFNKMHHHWPELSMIIYIGW